MDKSNESIICVLDDNTSVLRATCRLLISDGFKVEPFDDAATFLQYAKDQSVSVAIIDMVMPEMTGLEVLNHLRLLSPATRVIILTSAESEGAYDAALEAGAFGFFSKPFDADEFLASVAAACSSQNEHAGSRSSVEKRFDNP